MRGWGLRLVWAKRLGVVIEFMGGGGVGTWGGDGRFVSRTRGGTSPHPASLRDCATLSLALLPALAQSVRAFGRARAMARKQHALTPQAGRGVAESLRGRRIGGRASGRCPSPRDAGRRCPKGG